jgi:hypothetical protein
VLVAVAVLARGRGRVDPVARGALRPLAPAFPFVVGLPFALSLLLHGPTDDVPSSAYGDYVFWAARAVSAARSIVPFDDLLVADRAATYVEGGSTFLGATLTQLPGFDVFLFQTASLPALLLASVCAGLGLLASERDADRSPEDSRLARAAVLSTLAVAMIAYPSWLADSPPVSLAVPLTLALFELWRRPLPLRALLALSGVLAGNLYVTKGFVGVALLILLGVVLVRDHRETLRGHLSAPRVLAGLLAGALALGALWKLGLLQGPTAVLPSPELELVPVDALRGLREQLDARDTQALSPALAVTGQLLLAVALVRSRSYAVAVALVVGLVTSWTIQNYGFDLVIGVSVLLAVLVFWTRPASFEPQRALVLAAALSFALSTWFRDTAGVRAGFVFVALFGGAVLVTLLALEGPGRRAIAYATGAIGVGVLLGLSAGSLAGFAALVLLALLPALRRALDPAPRRLLLPVALGLALAATLAVAAVAASRDRLYLARPVVTLTTEHYDIWDRVGRLVPDDGLVFTSMTGETIDGEHGWNYYPGVAARQLYIAGWYDGPLLVEPEERARRLRLNRRILSGEARPAADPVARAYAEHFAVIRTSERAPASFRRVYANDRFELYRIPA